VTVYPAETVLRLWITTACKFREIKNVDLFLMKAHNPTLFYKMVRQDTDKAQPLVTEPV
jgi:hypothetical protein